MKNIIFLNSAKKHLNILFALHTKHLEGKYDFQKGGGNDFIKKIHPAVLLYCCTAVLLYCCTASVTHLKPIYILERITVHEKILPRVNVPAKSKARLE